MSICQNCGEERDMCRCANGFMEWVPTVTVGSELRRNLEENPAFAKAFGDMMTAIAASETKKKKRE